MEIPPVTMIELRTLGDSQILLGEERLGPQSPFAFAVGLYLAVERGRPHPRDELLGLFLPGVPEANGAHSLRQTLYKLRQLGFPAETTPAGTMVGAADVRDDYSCLLATHELADPRAERLPGAFLPGYWPKVSDEFTRWLEAQRDAVNGALRRAYVARILDRRAVARWDEVERFARACLAVDPLNEEATLALAEALALSGAKAAGVKVLDRYIEEVGGNAGPLALPAGVLRKRISERRTAVAETSLPLIGRESEMRELSEHLRAARQGASVTLWLHGEPGIGKSRLLQECCAAALVTGMHTVSSACRPHDVHRPAGVIRDLVPLLLKSPGAAGCSPDAWSLLGHFANDPAATQITPQETQLEGLRAPSQLAHAISELIAAVASETPLVVLVDDAHWADPLSLSVLLKAFSATAATHVVFVVSSRLAPAALPPRDGTVQIRHIRGIQREHAAALLRRAVGPSTTPIATETLERALLIGAGNPFFLRSLAHHIAHAPDNAPFPAHIASVLEERIRSASPTSELIVLACSALGTFATAEALEAVLQLPRYQLASELDALERDGLIALSSEHVDVVHAIVSDSVARTVRQAAALVIRRNCALTLQTIAHNTGDSAAYWTARECWLLVGDHDAAQRCIVESQTMDALGGLIQLVDCADTAKGILIPLSDEDPKSSFLAVPPAWQPPCPDIDHAPSHADYHEGLLALARDASQSSAARLRAAVGMLAIAEHSINPQLGSQAYEIAVAVGQHATGPAAVDLLRAHLEYHTTFGDPETALRLAHRIAATEGIEYSAAQRPRVHLLVGEALFRCGDGERALHHYSLSYDQAIRHGNKATCAAAAVHAVHCARQIANRSALVEWRERSVLTASDPSNFAYSSFLYNEALLALDAGSYAQASDHVMQVRRRIPPLAGEYHRHLLDALEVRARCSAGDVVTWRCIERLEHWCLHSAGVVPDDDVALSAATALQRSSSARRALQFIEEYHARRRPALPRLGLLEQLYQTLALVH